MSKKISELLASNKHFEIIAKVANEKKVDSYVIGGYVRDFLLHRPCKDIDIMCLGSGIDFAHEVAKAINPNVDVKYFKNFGTAMLKAEDYVFEFVGARKESYRRESRNPIVEDGTLEDDFNRRDFTINALAVSLNEKNRGELIDKFDGLKDLDNKIIRTPLDPDITFSDDPLRMMRAIRFASQLDFEIEAKTLASIEKNAARITIVSMERITDELNKIILSPIPSVGFHLLFDTGLLSFIFPQLENLKGVDVIKNQGHKDNFYHTIEVLDNISMKTHDLWLRWAAILHDIAKPKTKRFNEKSGWTFHGHEVVGAKMVPQIFKQFKLPQDQKMRFVQKMVALHLRPIPLARESITDSAIRRLLFDAGDDIEHLMTLCEADITSKNERKVQQYLSNFKLVREKLKEIEEKDSIRNWQPPISGELIMKTFNLKPCREIGVIKDAIKDAILDGQVENNYDAAYIFMLEKGKELGLNSN